MAMFVNVSNVSINLDRICSVTWGKDLLEHPQATVHFCDGATPLVLFGEDAADLSNIITELEARTERQMERQNIGLYSDEDALLDMEAAMLSGPPHCA